MMPKGRLLGRTPQGHDTGNLSLPQASPTTQNQADLYRAALHQHAQHALSETERAPKQLEGQVQGPEPANSTSREARRDVMVFSPPEKAAGADAGDDRAAT